MVNAFHYSRLFVINLRADFRQSSILYTTSTTTVARLIYDQTSSNSRNYTAQGVGNNSCCKTLPISADDDDERAETEREEEERKRERERGMNLLSTYMCILSRIP